MTDRLTEGSAVHFSPALPRTWPVVAAVAALAAVLLALTLLTTHDPKVRLLLGGTVCVTQAVAYLSGGTARMRDLRRRYGVRLRTGHITDVQAFLHVPPRATVTARTTVAVLAGVATLTTTGMAVLLAPTNDEAGAALVTASLSLVASTLAYLGGTFTRPMD